MVLFSHTKKENNLLTSFSYILLICSVNDTYSLNYEELHEFDQTLNTTTLKITETEFHQATSPLKSAENKSLLNKSYRDNKVEGLGLILKKKVEMLHTEDTKKLEIVFLIDASSSVGDQNFISELKFIKKLLADFSISENETRAAVITFSDPDKVFRHVDHISVPSFELHKCNMLHQDLPNIKYSGGLTYTIGALIEAQSVLEWSRAGARKAIFLVTDGFSNGGDPIPVAQILKNNGTFIFTFGIQSGNTAELENIASSPKEEFSYLVDSFDQFEAVGRRALHQDLTVGSYQSLSDVSLCHLICPDSEKEENGCCDSHARCSCGTGSGHYRCLCNPGYYGSGLKNSCWHCPNGTYHDGQRPGDVSSCISCPDPNHITVIGNASSKSSCVCQQGFVAQGDFCKVITCPLLYPPENGYFVKGGMCQNVFNAACGMRCKPGYTLHGSSIRLCQETGTWSGKAPKCVVKMCPTPEKPHNGSVRCSLEPPVSNDLMDPRFKRNTTLASQYAVDTECQFTCNPGHIIIGSRRRTCLPLARWDGLRTVCKPVTCRPLTKPVHGKITPESCTDSSKLPFGQKCDISCDEGYRLVGPLSRKCAGKGGLWTMKATPSKCIDEQPPVVLCPANIVVSTDFGEAFATVIVPQPTVYDNSGKTPITWSQPTVSSPIAVPIGLVQVSFIAMDPSHNQAMCNMTITVLDKEPPVVDSCISPEPIHLFESKGISTVKWNEPEFHDNSGKIFKVNTSPMLKEFPVGKTEVSITAYDESGNNSTCVLEVIVEDSVCSQNPPNIPNASVVCTHEQEKVINCSMICKEGYVFENSFEETNKAFLSQNSSYSFLCTDVQMLDLPRCAEAVLPNSVSQKGEVVFIGGEGACNNTELITKLKSAVEFEFSKKLEEVCLSSSNILCSIYNTNASCEEIASLKEEETNIIHQVKRDVNSDTSRSAPLNYRPYQRLLKRDTTSSSFQASSINVQFEVVGQLQNTIEKKMLKSEILSNNGFNQLKKALGKASISVPANVREKTLQWKGKGPVLVCSDGSVVHSTGICVKCPTGTFFSNATHKCLPCPLGEYQNIDGQTKCLQCPKGMSTKYGGSQHVHDCLYLCQPGSFGRILISNPSRNGGSVSPCTLCHPGTYQPNYGATSCLPCPSGLHPFKKGSKSVKDCFQLFAKSGKGVWLHSTNCASHMCQNGGSCRALSLGFVTCDCPFGFYGSFCESVYYHCNSSPCLNGGQCVQNYPMGYTCKCPSGYIGKNCEEEIDDCSPNPCLNNSTCEDLSDGYFCDCSDGFRGANCEENIDDCVSKPCGDNGLCVDGISSYTCTCVDGYSGQNCETEPVDTCLENNPCMNGATCLTTPNGMHKCICPFGFEGNNCGIIDSCSSSPCLNNGICVKKGVGGHICNCKTYFTGDDCETSLLSEFVMHMHSPSVTDYAMVDLPSQNFDKITACMWLQSKDGFNYGTAFSYATKHQFNMFTLTDYNGFVLYVNGNKIVTDVSTNDGLWHHVCVTWQSNLGLWSIYLDGFLSDSGAMLSPNSKVNGGGKFVVGQEQDSLGSSFSEAESLIGRIYRLDLWDEILSAAKIHQIAKECHQSLEGSLIKWTDFLPNIHGNVKIENSTFCLECPHPETLWHGTVAVTNDGNGSIATYECESGFVIHKTSLRATKRHCLKQGYWEGSSPVCVRRSCGFPGNLPGGVVVGNSFLFTDIVTYACHFGAQIIGDSTQTCQADGNWSGVPPICKGLECPSLIPPKYGKITVDRKVGGIRTAQFSCESGFYIDGVEVLTCMYDGTWDETVPDCLPNICPLPPRIQHAILKHNFLEKFSFMDIVYYECEKGYMLTASSSSAIYCNKDGEWCPFFNTTTQNTSVNLPSCEVQSCGKLDDIPNGRWLLKNGTAINSHNYSGDSVLVMECETNYEMYGPKTKYCKDNVWLPLDITQCVKVSCDTEGLPFDVPHSVLHISGEEVGDSATLSCKDGYQLSRASTGERLIEELSAEIVPNNSVTWMCNSESSWTINTTSMDFSSSETLLLACLPKRKASSILCSRPKAPSFGYLSTNDAETDRVAGTIIAIQCRTGFWLDGSRSIVCGENGLWHGSAVCKPVKCRSLPPHHNMFIMSTTAVGQEMEFGNLVSFSCIPGFKAHGDLSVRCQSTGLWSPLRGKCIME
ncbi:sushi, von Willebrand factor type A, EGF and pentraxin domain-containing protein 1 isoform X1 [Frankliniella occidentalis]|uniref:Sushi, von Willebrand factor type A, EGF and pentraxin domain-containing protein 1 isoform X1 n=2 Tax=Frankliniella occidentalis TaxID=133901 RepID=A0A6J1T0H8_FRAOC|nr:sushi, von Willebrand factor type A, EGF and pentraxin domain-containing protein 1 isoform X1 [Frankliniella occidentalis]XP_026284203.1 sushi, von Willebrand factor type A, EGF and pentraxin domain-containing protein 1 isoform X1 [Frankliniella occidentalis]XP_026284211.1 sushi, von Willebrand factor type A, EGF and pentraxin domain-containing protein 1 isoform X1 [Frankliniella occidentalis]XP_052127825.1 sushi, von Willebrand factor type A, EGF and pentraxin domain-containing protein 1 iso